jgi:hypothetical protein
LYINKNRIVSISKMKQTAVDWFQEQIIKIINGKCELSEIEIYNKAKEMEKEQIIEAFNKGNIYEGNFFDRVNINAEQYYNETFKSE